MLKALRIRNVALIEELDMEWFAGLSVLTGETGAGKSIMIEALNFVLGERASRELIQSGAQKAAVEAVFSLAEGEPVTRVLTEYELLPEDGELLLYRELSLSGKGVCRVGGAPVTTAMLKEIGDELVDIHGQHQHQQLLNPKLHIGLLDAFSGPEALSLRERTAVAHAEMKRAEQALSSSHMDQRDRERRCDLLAYQLKEIDGADLTDGEEETLAEERDRLVNAQAILSALEQGAEALSGDSAALSLLAGAMHALTGVRAYHKDYADAADRLSEAYYSLEDVAATLRDLREGFSFDPEQLDRLAWRLDLIHSLKRKYGGSIAEILAFRDKIAAELEELSGVEERREALERAYEAARTAYGALAEALSRLRHAAAERLSGALLPNMADLGMPNASFSVAFTALPVEEGRANGVDAVEFLLSTNRGEPEKPLSKVASGGEVSRIMLVFKTALAHAGGIPTMVFDEIDSGISGRVGTAVAVKMQELAQTQQVLCITHLPQIAAFADRQYLVHKETRGEQTRSTATLLDGAQRVQEVARIMGGENDPIALEHARRLIATARTKQA